MAALRQAALELGDLPDLVERSDEQVLAELAHLIESAACGSAPRPARRRTGVVAAARPRRHRRRRRFLYRHRLAATTAAATAGPPERHLFVEVYDDAGKLITEEVEITATGPQSLLAVVKAGSTPSPGSTWAPTASRPRCRRTSSTPTAKHRFISRPAGGTGKAGLDFKWLLNV